MRQVGVITKQIIDSLSLDIEENTPIFISENNERHVKERHPYEYEYYYPYVEEILATPDYVRRNMKHNSIDYIKAFQFGNDYVQASVRVDASGTLFVRTVFQVMSYKMERYIKNGFLVKIN